MDDYDNRLSHKWFLEGFHENNKAWIIPIDKNPFLIGRRDDCNLALSSKNISRRHAEIYYKGSSLMIRDLDSTNGTFINDKRIKNDSILTSGDSLKFANYKFKIYLKSYQDDNAVTITDHVTIPEKPNNFIDHFELTRREEEILHHLLQGKSTKKIADILFISVGTAKNHILNIFKKTNVHSKFELLTLYNNFIANK
jgi:DNA-binding CsgD family transcriptional regulator